MRIQFADFTLDSASRQLVRGGVPVHLSPKAFDALCLLAGRHPSAVSKTELYDHLWPGTFVVEANLAVLVGEIRRALDDDPRASRFIRTVHRFGYAFCSDVIDPSGVPQGGREPGPARAWLAWQERVVPLAEGETLIGRDPSCAIWIDVPGVSRRHARIVIAGTAATVEDLRSTNGTFVGGTAVAGVQRLADGDLLQLGPVDMRFRTWSDGDGRETVKIARER